MTATILSVNEAADMIKMSGQSIRNAIKEGSLKAERVGKQWVISEKELIKYVKENNVIIEPDDHERVGNNVPKIIALSFFSGAMGLDIGMEKAGIHALLACEFDKNCRKTIHSNRPKMALIGDINNYSADEIRKIAKIPEDKEIDVMFGGPPCQAFSTAGNRKGFEDNRGNVFLRYLELASQLKPKILVIENVRGLMSTPYYVNPNDPDSKIVKGAALYHILKIIKKMGYSVSFNLYNSANFGSPQIRERFVILCHRDGIKIPYLTPTNSEDEKSNLPKWKTLRSAIIDLDEKEMHHCEFPERRLKYYRLLKEGQYWKDLPPELQPEAMGKSYNLPGGKTGFYRRLSFDKPSPTLVTDPTMPATDLCHPTKLRPLSIEEYKRIQEFPDNWIVAGDIKSQYRQIGNAVPISLGYAIGKMVMSILNGEAIKPIEGFSYSRYKFTNDQDFINNYEKILKKNTIGTDNKSNKQCTIDGF